MKNLIFKEIKLSLHPTNLIFMSFPLMLLIPNYPSYIAFIYLSLSVFFLFLSARENKDIYYTSLLPIKKTDQVKSRLIIVMGLELLQIIISIPFAFIHFNLHKTNNLAGIEPNLAFYGFLFGMFAIFNFFFFTNFYKKAYPVGKPLIIAGSIIMGYYLLVESLVWIPSDVQAFLDARDMNVIINQWPILVCGIVIWVGLGFITNQKSAKRFQKVDV